MNLRGATPGLVAGETVSLGAGLLGTSRFIMPELNEAFGVVLEAECVDGTDHALIVQYFSIIKSGLGVISVIPGTANVTGSGGSAPWTITAAPAGGDTYVDFVFSSVGATFASKIAVTATIRYNKTTKPI